MGTQAATGYTRTTNTSTNTSSSHSRVSYNTSKTQDTQPSRGRTDPRLIAALLGPEHHQTRRRPAEPSHPSDSGHNCQQDGPEPATGRFCETPRRG